MYEIAVRIFLTLYTTVGPYDTLDQCRTTLAQYRIEYQAKYESGERMEFLGKIVNPSNVTAFCRLRK